MLWGCLSPARHFYSEYVLNQEIKEICDTLNQSKEQHKYRSKIAKYLPPNIIKTLDPVIHRDYISSFYDPNKASRDSSISCDINHVMNNVEEKNSSLDTHDLLRKIVHEEFLNLKTEANLGTCELLTTQCNLASNPNNINYEKVANIIYKKRLAIPYTLKQIGCKDFIKSYPPNNFKNCSQQEYNLVLTQLMGNDTKDALLARVQHYQHEVRGPRDGDDLLAASFAVGRALDDAR